VRDAGRVLNHAAAAPWAAQRWRGHPAAMLAAVMRARRALRSTKLSLNLLMPEPSPRETTARFTRGGSART
jgi:hypothetical protein